MSRWLTRAYAVNWYTVAYVVIFIVAIVTRFAGLGDRVMSHDESLHTYYSYQLYRHGDFQHTPLMHGPILFHITAFFYFLFGASDFTARLYPAILGVMMVLFPLLFRRWLGRTGALLCSVLILISPLLLYHHRYIREDTPSIFATMVMAYCIFMYLDGPLHLRRRARWLYIFSGAMLWSLASKEVAFMYIAIFGSFLTLYWVFRMYQYFRKVPVKSAFYMLVISILIGGTVSLIMYAILSIALGSYPTLEGRVEFLAQNLGSMFSGQSPLDITLFTSWTAVLAAVTIAIVFGTAIWAFRRSRAALRVREILLILVLSLIVCAGLIVGEEYSKLPSRDDTLVEDPDNEVLDITAETNLPIVATWVISGIVIAAVIYSYRAGWWKTLYRFAELDILILMGTLVLPWLTSLPVSMTGASPVDYSPAGITRSLMIFIPLAAVSITVGLAWNWKRWLIAAAIFHILFVFFFTTMFTNPMGLVTGMIGSLGYWLEQQGVRRGSQPQYYYQLVIMPVYEYLPVIGSFIAMLAGLGIFWNHRRERLEAELSPLVSPYGDDVPPSELLVEPEANTAGSAPDASTGAARRRLPYNSERLARVPFLLFMSWWGVFIFQAFTLAGEKMPWLGTHLTLPFIFLTAWYFGRLLDRVNWVSFRQRGWLYLLLMPLLGVALFQVVSPFLTGQNPLSGLTQAEQQARNQWLAVIFVCVIVAVLIARIASRTGWLQMRRMIGVSALVVLSLLTFRTAWMASFINYDYATEYMVYAHGAPGIKLMMSQIEELSRRVSGGMNMRFAWAGNNWPVTWYFRDLTNVNYMGTSPTIENARNGMRDAVAVYISEDLESTIGPLLEDNYYRFEYMRMWWPSWNYYNLNAQRAANALDFSSENTQAAQIRWGIWDIWWARDYTRYGEATGENYSPENWNPGEHLIFYVRKDIAAQVWNLGLGEGSAVNTTQTTVNMCTENWQQRYADYVFTDSSGQPMRLNHPIDITVGLDGTVYVAEEFSNRVVVFDANGVNTSVITTAADGTLNRPHGVAVDANGNLYVTEFDFNFEHVDVISPSGELLANWGTPGQFGAAAGELPVDGMWGPRDVALDLAGNVYVSDTGNKRIRVYTAQGEHLRDIGSAGSGTGQLDESSGIAISNDGRLFVADRWNRRVSVFTLDGTPLYTFEVRGWLQDLGNRPYLAVDSVRNLLYVGDPEAGRVLVYDTQGNCLGSFGQPAENPSDLSQFKSVSGIALDSAGNVYVVDSGVGRVLRFAPFIDTVVVPPAVGSDLPLVEATLEVTSEVEDTSDASLAPEATSDVTSDVIMPPETTAEPLPDDVTMEAVG